jgi:hypothetical protein
MVTVPFLQQKARSRARAPVRAICEPAVGLGSVTSTVTYGELEAGADDGAEAAAAASAAELADEEAAAAASAADEADAAAESAEGAAVSVLAQATSASAATRALRASFVFIELYPEKESKR